MQRNPETVGEMLTLICTLLDDGQTRQALEAIRHFGVGSPEMANAQAVALIFAGETEKAVEQFRHMVLYAGGVSLKPGIPRLYQANYAAALLVSGHVAGCRAVLDEINDEHHPAVLRLRETIARWASTLPWWRRVWFRLSGEGPKLPVTLSCKPSALLVDHELRPAA